MAVRLSTERRYPMSTLSAPSGVTRIAGANAYAAKFAISPTTTAAYQPICLSGARKSMFGSAYSSLFHPTTAGS
jgi:hypothetical protein